MRVAVMTARGELQVEDSADPTIQTPTDAIIRLSATSICGSGLWHHRGIETLDGSRRWVTSTPTLWKRFLATSDLLGTGRFAAVAAEVGFDLKLPLDDAGDGYKAMDERCAIKALPRP